MKPQYPSVVNVANGMASLKCQRTGPMRRRTRSRAESGTQRVRLTLIFYADCWIRTGAAAHWSTNRD